MSRAPCPPLQMKRRPGECRRNDSSNQSRSAKGVDSPHSSRPDGKRTSVRGGRRVVSSRSSPGPDDERSRDDRRDEDPSPDHRAGSEGLGPAPRPAVSRASGAGGRDARRGDRARADPRYACRRDPARSGAAHAACAWRSALPRDDRGQRCRRGGEPRQGPRDDDRADAHAHDRGRRGRRPATGSGTSIISSFAAAICSCMARGHARPGATMPRTRPG
ncbi:hypothetical protein DFO80_12228 [Rhodobacter sp. 140A]|nr:hypothetical protein DFO80_12228 [Rhodobacter sp. 140A]